MRHKTKREKTTTDEEPTGSKRFWNYYNNLLRNEKNEKWTLFVDLVKMSKYLYDIVNSKILNIDDGSGGSDVGI